MSATGELLLVNHGRARRTYEDSEQQVHNANEGLRTEQALPEVHRSAHLREESNEEQCSSVSVNHRVYSIELRGKIDGLLLVCCRWRASESPNRLDGVDKGGLRHGSVVWIVVSGGDHDDDEISCLRGMVSLRLRGELQTLDPPMFMNTAA